MRRLKRGFSSDGMVFREAQSLATQLSNEYRWVYGSESMLWHFIDYDDRDFKVALSNDKLLLCSDESEAKNYYLRPWSLTGENKESRMRRFKRYAGEPLGIGGAEICICPECGYEIEHERGLPCNVSKCPNCGIELIGERMPHGIGRGAYRKYSFTDVELESNRNKILDYFEGGGFRIEFVNETIADFFHIYIDAYGMSVNELSHATSTLDSLFDGLGNFLSFDYMEECIYSDGRDLYVELKIKY